MRNVRFKKIYYLNRYYPGRKRNSLATSSHPLVERLKSLKKHFKHKLSRSGDWEDISLQKCKRNSCFKKTVLHLHIINIRALLPQVSDQFLERCNLLIYHKYPNLTSPNAVLSFLIQWSWVEVLCFMLLCSK